MPKQTPQSRYTDADIDKILPGNQQLADQNSQLQAQLTWFKRQIFGNKSEQLQYLDNPDQAELQLGSKPDIEAPVIEQEIKSYKRRQKKSKSGTPDDSGIQFDENEVDVLVIEIPCPELDGEQADDYEVIGTTVDYRLAQRRSAYVMLKYVRKVVKHRHSQQIKTAAAAAGIFERNQWDVSFIVGLLIEKFLYHQPLYRQHQRLCRSGIEVSRATLTNITHRAIPLLEPIVDALLANVLRSHTLAMDETPIKAGHKTKGKLHQGCYLPLYGDQDEMVFNYSPSKSRKAIEGILASFTGSVLLTDGNIAYELYTKTMADVVLAQCWSHCRRYFERAYEAEPVVARAALDMIARLYKQDGRIQESWPAARQIEHRASHCQPITHAFFEWCNEQHQRVDLLPKNPFRRALKYACDRQQALQEFLTDPTIALDTNHLERGLRVIPMGRRNWLFCWTEPGAKYVGLIQSLIVTCRLHGVDPAVYLTDVLQRVKTHPDDKMIELTPRVWKTKFADNPLISDLEGAGKNGVI